MNPLTNVVLHGDAVETMKTLREESVDVVLCDVPYSSGTRREAAKGIRKSMTTSDDAEWFGTDSLTVLGFQHLMRVCALEWHRVLKPGGHALIFIDWRMGHHLSPAVESADLRIANEIIWDKGRPGMGVAFRSQYEKILHFTKGVGREARRRDVGNLIRCSPVHHSAAKHPTEKPIPLLRTMLDVVSFPGDVVLDSFAGSGATGVAALEVGAQYILIEREAKYVEIARAWLEATAAQERLFAPGAMPDKSPTLDLFSPTTEDT